MTKTKRFPFLFGIFDPVILDTTVDIELHLT